MQMEREGRCFRVEHSHREAIQRELKPLLQRHLWWLQPRSFGHKSALVPLS